MIRFTVRDMIWVYFWCLIFEGAFRKWFLPGLSAPLLILRDPVVILIYIMSIRNGSFPWNTWIFPLFVLGMLMAFFGLFASEFNLFVYIFGLRTNILHIPLCFIIAKAINRKDFEKIGNWIIFLLLPMGCLMVFQFLSAPDSFINTTAGGEGEQIGGTEGNIRPPGTFSFITGAAEYLGLSSAILLGFYITKVKINSNRYILGLLGLAMGLSVSISRLALSYVFLVMLMMCVLVVFRPHYLNNMMILIIISGLVFIMMLNLKFVQNGLSAFSERINAAEQAEEESGGFVGRIMIDYLSPINMIDETPLFGYGLGVGTSAGAKLISGDRAFLLSEGEWPRLILESGPLIGLGFLIWRVLFTIFLGFSSLKCAIYGYPLPILIFGACNQLLLIGQISRPTTLGFAVFGTGLCLVAIRLANEDYQMKRGQL